MHPDELERQKFRAFGELVIRMMMVINLNDPLAAFNKATFAAWDYHLTTRPRLFDLLYWN